MNKKLVSMVLIGGLSATLLTGCSKSDNKVKLFNIKINGKERSLFGFGGDESSESVNKAYDFFKESVSQYENSTKKYTKDVTGIGFTQEFTEIEREAYSHDYNKENILSYIRIAGEQSETNKKTMEGYGINDVDFYFKLVCGDDVIIEVRNGVLKQLNLGNDTLENEIINELNGTTIEKEEASKTCQYCGKEYKPSKSDAVESDKYCSSECYTEVRMMERNKDAKTETKKENKKETKKKSTKKTCKYCGKKYDPKTSNAWENDKFCSKICAVDYEEQQEASKPRKYKYYCAYCGKGYRPDEVNAPEGFCSELCAVNWEGQQHENWEKHHSYDSNGRVIPCEDHCGDGCE